MADNSTLANYLDFFFGEGNSNTQPIQTKVEQSGQTAVKNWKNAVAKTNIDAKNAFEQCYFEDDLQDIVKRISLALTMLDAIHIFHHEVIHSTDRMTPFYRYYLFAWSDIVLSADEKNSLETALVLNTFIDFFHALPHAVCPLGSLPALKFLTSLHRPPSPPRAHLKAWLSQTAINGSTILILISKR